MKYKLTDTEKRTGRTIGDQLRIGHLIELALPQSAIKKSNNEFLFAYILNKADKMKLFNGNNLFKLSNEVGIPALSVISILNKAKVVSRNKKNKKLIEEGLREHSSPWWSRDAQGLDLEIVVVLRVSFGYSVKLQASLAQLDRAADF